MLNPAKTVFTIVTAAALFKGGKKFYEFIFCENSHHVAAADAKPDDFFHAGGFRSARCRTACFSPENITDIIIRAGTD